MRRQDKSTFSVSAAAYARFKAAAHARGCSVSQLVVAALEGHLPEDDVRSVLVSAEVYRAVVKAARRRGQPIAEVFDAAIRQLLDDAARWCEAPGRSRRTCRTPRVAHASRRAS